MSVEFGDANGMAATLRIGNKDLSAADSCVTRAKTGDAAAFERLMRLHEAKVFRTALRLLGNEEDALDACQDVFLRMHKYLDGFDERKELSPWLYRMTVNVCRDIGKKRNAKTVPLTSAVEEAAECPVNPHRQLEAADERRIMEQGLLTLPEKERAAIVLRDIEGLTSKEAAEILGSTETTIRSQISRARTKLKRYRDIHMGECHEL